MKKISLLGILISFALCGAAQIAKDSRTLTPEETKDILRQLKIDSTKFLRESGNTICGCIDSIPVTGKNHKEMSEAISGCIDKEVLTYEGMLGVMNSLKGNDTSKAIIINADKESDQYRRSYYMLERWLKDSCKSITDKMQSNEVTSEHSLSRDEVAKHQYNLGVIQFDKENYADALVFFRKAVAADPQFAFAWDNIGVCERRLGNYDRAIEAYKTSLAIDPKSLTPLQNLPVVYELKKDYDKALEEYRNILKVIPDEPEAYYGMGRIYILMNEPAKALDNMCKAYKSYVKMGSPYRTDAEKNISLIYGIMKKNGQEKEFNKILEENDLKNE